jgi:hypothetical protein
MPQQQDQLHHILSRIALAKAIKTPDDRESEPWQKSVIFNQPFIKQLQNKRQQQLNSRQKQQQQQQTTIKQRPQPHKNMDKPIGKEKRKKKRYENFVG